MVGNHYILEVKSVLPEPLAALETLSNDLLYSWKAPIRSLFINLDKELWEKCGHRPKVFLRNVQQQLLDDAAKNPEYLHQYQQVLDWYRHYHQQEIHSDLIHSLNPDNDLIAYFCAEFGFHESLPIYSGGLGILAGDHCKAASDIGIPFVAVGLLYHQGYFTQNIGPDGQQISHNQTHYFGHLPITLLKDDNGQEIHTEITLPGRTLTLRIWQAKIGRVNLYLLDTDVASNSNGDRMITQQLYGDGHDTRIKQEIVLGIGGVKALRRLGLKPNVWHINEGHAAFQVLQRCIEQVSEGENFDAALESVAGSTVFTTHTPVAAGHDSFDRETIHDYFGESARLLNIDFERLFSLGISAGDPLHFNMTSLALRGSRYHNGVSKIHGGIASGMEQHIWPQVPAAENPMTYITNGVHVSSILANKWVAIFSRYCNDWESHLSDDDYRQCIDSISDADYWTTHQSLKATLIKNVCQRQEKQHTRNDSSKAYREATICHIQQSSGDILVMGFARRFATYKRATLLFSDIERLSRLLNNPDRPVVILFAGKAHPSDVPGQQLIKDIYHYSEQPEFVGKIILLEGYDLSLARRMISGCDVWLNTPIYPLEACGTSGQKAAINGVINLSVMDGWWAEGYNGDNGWSIAPHTDKYGGDYRNQQEASDLLDIIENEVIPAYFERHQTGIPRNWLTMSKASMKSSIVNFSARRMLDDYINKLYMPARQHHKQLSHNDLQGAKKLALWKQKVKGRWPGVSMSLTEQTAAAVNTGEEWSVTLGVQLNGLSPDDVIVELISGEENGNDEFVVENVYPFTAEQSGSEPADTVIYRLNIKPKRSGVIHYKLRMFPFIELLAHKFEMGYMYWL